MIITVNSYYVANEITYVAGDLYAQEGETKPWRRAGSTLPLKVPESNSSRNKNR